MDFMEAVGLPLEVTGIGSGALQILDIAGLASTILETNDFCIADYQSRWCCIGYREDSPFSIASRGQG